MLEMYNGTVIFILQNYLILNIIILIHRHVVEQIMVKLVYS